VNIKKAFPFVFFLSLMVFTTTLQSSNSISNAPLITNGENIIENNFVTMEYEVPTLPDEVIPEWEFNITGIGITSPVTLNLTYLIEQVNDSYLSAYEQIVEYKGNNQTIIGFDILQLVQYYADVWYAGEFEFIAEDDYSNSINATEIVYSYYPPAVENADIKILLAFAVNGSYLPYSDWADKGVLRVVAPSNTKYTYENKHWVSNVTEISITERWNCNIYVNNELKTSIPVNTEDTFTDFDYLTYELAYKSENTEFGGISILSIFEYLDIELDDITLFQAEAPDFLSTINKTELIGEKPAILGLTINNEYFGFDKGPIRLIGGNLNSWNWLKNCFALHITVGTTQDVPGFSSCASIFALLIITALPVIIKKRK